MTEHASSTATAGDDTPLMAAIRELDLPDRVLEGLAAYPDDTFEVLMDFAAELRRAGRAAQARRLLETVREHPSTSEDGQYASVELVDLLRESQDPRDTAEAERITSELLRPGRLGQGPAGLLGEYMRELERWDEALRCFNIAARQLLAEPPEELAGEDDLSLSPIVNRLLARMKLGLPHDGHDEVALVVAQRQAEGALGLPYEERGWPEEDGSDREVEALYSRAAFDGARARGLLTGQTAEHGADAYYRAAERSLRERDREHPGTPRSVVLHGVEDIVEFAERSGLDPADDGTALAWADLELAEGDPRLRSWPPGRNEPCWCSSGRKYKKCCGSPSNR
ncbi:SEC-C domain-containing protein [Nocardiopsis dassonvillei]|uniref:SEC-C metal-binding domain-containing protein n=1 Tax=Nocardiopsis dassonvillei TaxID=2014 RepID=UPI00200FF915|nr:SEC-C metal-binding domain-containing protein [Nocardiopsis dassonvillei]MCK9869503.1 SEC-C domain-containing protein [Nocardiopsis dassonvillei]